MNKESDKGSEAIDFSNYNAINQQSLQHEIGTNIQACSKQGSKECIFSNYNVSVLTKSPYFVPTYCVFMWCVVWACVFNQFK